MKKTLAQRADEFGITKDKLNAIKAKGINVWNDDEMEDHLKTAKTRANFKKSDGETSIESAQTVDEMEEMIRTSLDYNVIKVMSEKVKGLKLAHAYKMDTAESFTAAEVRERDARIGAAVRQMTMRIESDLPAQCEGLTATQLKRLLRDFAKSLLTDLANMQSDFWDDVAKRGVKNELRKS